MAERINHYRADLRDMRFLLFEQFRLQELLGKPPYADWGRDECSMVLDEVYRWACEVAGPVNRIGDQGCRFEDGEVRTPTGFREAYRSLYEVGWRSLAVDPKYGGQGSPFSLAVLAGEMLSGANTALNMYSALTEGVAEIIESFGTPEQIERYVSRLHAGVFAGTMCLTEPHAGSDVGSASTRAIPRGDGRYRIEGSKIFISGGQHDLAENIIHLVLARTPDAPDGTKGLSLFIVPRDRLDGSGKNHVVCTSIEHKMGINGSATAALSFGEGGECVGELIGTEEMQGIKQMFKLMNFARIGVGVQGLAVAGSAYLNALEYARERVQGPSIKNWKNPAAPKVPIIEHPNVRRFLLDMKSRVEGIRALIVKLANHIDWERVLRDSDPEAAAYHQGQVDLLVPLVKSYASDQGFDVTVTALQVHGGAGYLKDHPIEQYCRDAKIFSIYEGTNHIQALDLVGRKLGQKGGQNLRAYLKDLNDFAGENEGHPALGAEVVLLGQAAKAVGAGAMRFLGWSQAGQTELVALHANRFLRMMAETTVGWMLLQGAVVAESRLAELAEDHPEHAFYLGRRYSALYYARTLLPGVTESGALLEAGDRTPLDVPDAGLGRIG